MASPGIQIRIDVRDSQLRDAFRRALKRLGDLRPVLDAIGAGLVTSTRHRFETRTAPDGSPWPGLKESTRRRYARIGARGSLLRRTWPAHGKRPARPSYQLFNSITHKATATEVAAGSNARMPGGRHSLLAIHQLGGASSMAPGPAAIPARASLGLSDDDRRAIFDAINDAMREAL